MFESAGVVLTGPNSWLDTAALRPARTSEGLSPTALPGASLACAKMKNPKPPVSDLLLADKQPVENHAGAAGPPLSVGHDLYAQKRFTALRTRFLRSGSPAIHQPGQTPVRAYRGGR